MKYQPTKGRAQYMPDLGCFLSIRGAGQLLISQDLRPGGWRCEKFVAKSDLSTSCSRSINGMQFVRPSKKKQKKPQKKTKTLCPPFEDLRTKINIFVITYLNIIIWFCSEWSAPGGMGLRHLEHWSTLQSTGRKWNIVRMLKLKTNLARAHVTRRLRLDDCLSAAMIIDNYGPVRSVIKLCRV